MNTTEIKKELYKQKPSTDMIIKTSNLGYDMSFYKVSTNANTEQIKEAEFSGLIPTYRSSSTSIKQLKEACEKFGYSFEYEIIAERLNGWTDQVKELKIDNVEQILYEITLAVSYKIKRSLKDILILPETIEITTQDLVKQLKS